MYTRQIQMNDVIYNAAEQCFEAVVTVHDGDSLRKYACSINAPMSTSFADAAKGLSTQAERRHLGRGGMFSEVQKSIGTKPTRTARFELKSWLENITRLPGLKAA